MGKRFANLTFHRRIFLGTFFTSFSLSFFAAVLEAFWWCRDLLFSVFTAEIQCFSRFHEVHRGMFFLTNFRLFLDNFGSILAVQKSLCLKIFCSTAAGCILGPFWDHFGSILVTLWRPLGSLWAPTVVNFAPWWHPCRSLRPLVVSFGLLFGPFGHFGRIFLRCCRIFHGF